MPPVVPASPSRASGLALAQGRWDAILDARPDLGPAVELQRRLVAQLLDLAETIDRGRLPRLSLPSKYLAAKLGRAVPAVTGEPVPLPVQVLAPALVGLCETLAAGGAGEAAERIRSAITETRLDGGSLLAASLRRDQQAIRTAAVHRGLAPDLLWLVAELAVSPFIAALQRRLLAPAIPDAALAAALRQWTRGYCPACGSWPALAEVAGAHRTLRCSFCACAWELPAYACVYCGESGERFVTSAPDPARLDRRLEACSACGGYLKAVDVASLSPFPLLAIADLETVALDVAAMSRGYSRPSLPEIGV